MSFYREENLILCLLDPAKHYAGVFLFKVGRATHGRICYLLLSCVDAEDTCDVIHHLILSVALLENEVAATRLDGRLLVILDTLEDIVSSW